MSIIEIRLEDALGHVDEKVESEIAWAASHQLSFITKKEFPLLAYIDMYGDTLFNRVQIQEFLSEWNHLVELTDTDERRSMLMEVTRLAMKIKNEPGYYLRFLGD